MNNKLNKIFKVFTCVLLAMILSVSGVITSFADTTGGGNKAKRTIMVYIDGATSEANTPVFTAMLKEYMNAKFDRNDIRVIAMTGGSLKWHLESKYLRDQDGNSGTLSEISNEYNQIWEVFGTTDNAEGYLKLLDADGVTGDGADARKSEDELMSDPETLKGFINFARNYAPAERYGLILNDHGSGPAHGYGYDNHNTVNPDETISVLELKHAISESDVVQNEGKFDFIDLDCCVMSNFETILTLSDYTDCYLGSPDIDPHATVDYTDAINYLSTDPDMEAKELGKKIVDLFVDFYEKYPEKRSVGNAVCYCMVDTKALKESGFIEEMLKIAKQLRTEATGGTFYDEIRVSKDDYKFAVVNLQDLATVIEQLGINIYESDWQDPSLGNEYTETALKLQNILHNKEIIYSRYTDFSSKTSVFLGRDDDGSINVRSGNVPTGGLSIFYPYNPTAGDSSKELSYYIDAMKELAAESENETEKDWISTYLQAVIDYDLIYNAGIAVTNLADNGCDINEIDFDKVKEYFESQAENNRWNYISKTISSSDRDVEAWLNTIIDIQKNEVLSREKISVKTENRDGTDYYRVNITDTPKRIIDIPVLKVTAKTDNYPFSDPTMTFYGNKSDEESFEDYISNVNSSYIIPKFDGQWYVVEDSEGVKHIASKASDQSVFAKFSLDGKDLGVGELLFDEAGNAKSIYIYGNTIPISLDSLEGIVMVTLSNDPNDGKEWSLDMPFMLEKTNARLVKDQYSNLGIENIEIKLAITDMYGVEHEIKPKLTFDPNGGTWKDGGSAAKEYEVDLEEEFEIIDAPKRDGYTFEYWEDSEYQPGQKYTVTESRTFKAKWKSTAATGITKAKVSGIKAKTWTGKALKQSPVVKLSGKTLKNGKDYTVTYKNNKNVGKATVTIKGKGSCTGTITKTFKINPKGSSISKLTRAKKAVTVKWKKQSTKMSKSPVSGYQIQLATDKKFTKNKKTVAVKGYKKVSKKFSKLKGKTKYYVRIRTYKTVGGIKYCSSWSKAKTV